MSIKWRSARKELEATSSETTQAFFVLKRAEFMAFQVQSQYLKSLQTALAAQQEQLSSEALDL